LAYIQGNFRKSHSGTLPEILGRATPILLSCVHATCVVLRCASW
jgi:hypothetical protein